MLRIPLLPFMLLAVAAGPGAGAQPLSEPRSFVFTGTAHVGGLHAGDGALRIEVEDRALSVRLNAESQGLIRLMFEAGFELNMEGTLAPGARGFRPDEYRSTRRHRSKRVSRHVRFRDGFAETVQADGEEPYPHPVPSEERLDVFDPASALLTAGIVLARTSSCDQSIRVFDGKGRSDLVLRDGGRGPLPGRAGAERGDEAAWLCAFRSQRVAGYSERQLRKPPLEGRIWFLPIDETLMLPVRLQARTPMGMAVIQFDLPTG